MTIAYIGMGGNVASSAGEPEETLTASAASLSALGTIVARSRLYRTKPVGHVNQPQFVNAVVALETRLGPRMLLHRLMQIEARFGRERQPNFRNGPRTLDLDIVFYGDAVMEAAGLVIPHPRMSEREFVLRPLAEIAPHVREPRSGKTAARLLADLAALGGVEAEGAVALDSETWGSPAEEDQR
jgi:2-amino-4-hydroxy-6-hydroxymethyldihydropteridine diphosphokinase